MILYDQLSLVSLVHLAYTLPLLGKRLHQKNMIYWWSSKEDLPKLYHSHIFFLGDKLHKLPPQKKIHQI